MGDRIGKPSDERTGKPRAARRSFHFGGGGEVVFILLRSSSLTNVDVMFGILINIRSLITTPLWLGGSKLASGSLPQEITTNY